MGAVVPLSIFIASQELIKLLGLSAQFAEQLHPSVRKTYHDLWAEAQASPPSP